MYVIRKNNLYVLYTYGCTAW